MADDISFNAPPPISDPIERPVNGNIGGQFSQALYDQMNSNPNDGGVSKEELKSYLESKGTSVVDSELDAFFKQADADADGQLNYQEMETSWHLSPYQPGSTDGEAANNAIEVPVNGNASKDRPGVDELGK